MKKILLAITVLGMLSFAASAQVIPSVQFGIKGGVNLSKFTTDNTFASSNQAGYLAGFYARFGALGFNFQPEVYVTGKDVKINDNGTEFSAKFTSIDVPLLFGGKFGAFGLGGRLYTGPVASFAINKDQSFKQAANKALTLDYHDANAAWQFGAGLDIRGVSVDARYEAGITKQGYVNSAGASGNTRINLFSLALAFRLF